jgi:hypothetical protein
MTPPAKWFIDKEDGSVVVCTFVPGSATSSDKVDKQGIVSDISTGLSRGKQVLRVSECSSILLYINSNIIRLSCVIYDWRFFSWRLSSPMGKVDSLTGDCSYQ